MGARLPLPRFLMLLFLTLAALPAAAFTWLSFGGPEPVIRQARVFPNSPSSGTNTVYLATLGAGVLKGTHTLSTDDMTYVQLNNGLPDLRIRAFFAISTTQFFVATEAHGIYASTDGGSNWNPINGTGTTLGCTTLRNMQVVSATELWALGDCRYNSGLWHTTDGGANWTHVGAPSSAVPGPIPEDAAVNSMTFASSGTVVMIATAEYGIFRSTDSGAHWAQVNGFGGSNPIADDGAGHVTANQVVNRSTATEMIASIEGDGVYISSDAGANWTRTLAGNVIAGISKVSVTTGTPPNQTTALVYYVGIDKQGIYYSTDSGATWNVWGNSQTNDTRLLFTRSVTPDGTANPSVYYIPMVNGMMWTKDNGASFADRGMPQTGLNSMSLHPNGHTAYASVDAIYRIDDVYNASSGNPTELLNGLGGTTVDGQVLIDGSNASTLYATTNWEGLYKSIDAGTTWSLVSTLSYAPHTMAHVRLTSGTPNVIWVGLTNPYGTATGGGLFVSTDGGTGWTDITGNLPAPYGRHVNSVSPDPSDSNTIVAATAGGVYRTTDGGTTWTQTLGGTDAGGTPRPASYVRHDPAHPGTVYVAAENVDADGTVHASSGIWKSTDGGVTWTHVLAGRAQQVRVEASGKVVALFHHDLTQPPVMSSIDGGSTWQEMSDGISPSGGRTLVQTMDGTGRVVAASTDTGIFLAPALGMNDFNRDGHPDIVWSNTANGSTYVWHMTGTPPVLLGDAFVAQIDPSWKIVGIGDFNRDGNPDLVWRNTANGNCYVWYMVDATFQSDASLFSLPPQWVVQGVADFNGDGFPDFLMRNTDPASGVGFVWYFNNNVPIGSDFLFGIDPTWKVEQVGDVNGDGQPDLLFRNTSSGLAFAWYTQYSGGTTSLAGSSPPIFSIDPQWEIVQLDDWDGDGNRDLLFRNVNSGVVFVWYMVGTTLGGSDYVIQIDPSWEIVPRH